MTLNELIKDLQGYVNTGMGEEEVYVVLRYEETKISGGKEGFEKTAKLETSEPGDGLDDIYLLSAIVSD